MKVKKRISFWYTIIIFIIYILMFFLLLKFLKNTNQPWEFYITIFFIIPTLIINSLVAIYGIIITIVDIVKNKYYWTIIIPIMAIIPIFPWIFSFLITK